MVKVLLTTEKYDCELTKEFSSAEKYDCDLTKEFSNGEKQNCDLAKEFPSTVKWFCNLAERRFQMLGSVFAISRMYFLAVRNTFLTSQTDF